MAPLYIRRRRCCCSSIRERERERERERGGGVCDDDDLILFRLRGTRRRRSFEAEELLWLCSIVGRDGRMAGCSRFCSSFRVPLSLSVGWKRRKEKKDVIKAQISDESRWLVGWMDGWRNCYSSPFYLEPWFTLNLLIIIILYYKMTPLIFHAH